MEEDINPLSTPDVGAAAASLQPGASSASSMIDDLRGSSNHRSALERQEACGILVNQERSAC
eukprot:m.370100 g.370100  ORF g.370100 m.370100 type:complete len:62 (-) comp16680_c1_seq39:2948-3133(-)